MEEQAEISRRRTGERARVSSLSQHEVDSVFPSNHSNAAEQTPVAIAPTAHANWPQRDTQTNTVARGSRAAVRHSAVRNEWDCAVDEGPLEMISVS